MFLEYLYLNVLEKQCFLSILMSWNEKAIDDRAACSRLVLMSSCIRQLNSRVSLRTCCMCWLVVEGTGGLV